VSVAAYNPAEFDVDDPRQETNASKTCKLWLAKDDARATVDISWHPGIVSQFQRGRRIEKYLMRGDEKPAVVPLERALSIFGPFTVPRELATVRDPRKREELEELYAEGKARALVAHGDYPRPRKFQDGQHEIGPHRFPHVIAVVVSADGSESEPYDLHEVYKIGEYDQEHLRPSYFRAQAGEPEVDVLKQQLADKDREYASLAGKVDALTAIVSGSANPAKIREKVGA
jgi:hypothetical protein